MIQKLLKSTLIIASLLVTNLVAAQMENPIQLPASSPKAVIHQQIGVTDISISYNRPQVKGREIFGKLIPFGKVWRTGADENTILTFTTDVQINGTTVKAGAYGLHTIPNKDRWTVILNKETKAWGSYFYNKEKDVLRFEVPTTTTAMKEAMNFEFSKVSENSTTISLNWEKTSISFEITLNSEELVQQHIKSQLNSLPWFGWTGLYNAATYNLENDVYLDDALVWINRSIRNNRNYSNLTIKAKILEKQGKESAAKSIHNQALIIAAPIELQRAAYSKFTANQSKEGIDLLKNIIKNAPNNYRSYLAVAWGYEQIKDDKSALKMYKKALKIAPADTKENIEKAMVKLQ